MFEGIKADGAIKGLHPHGDIKPLGAVLFFLLRFNSSLAGVTTIHHQQTSKGTSTKNATEIRIYLSINTTSMPKSPVPQDILIKVIELKVTLAC